jgi:phage baseplate assembly protein W
MQGINATTGKPLADIDHLRQSIRDILTTPIGSRVMRRDYGSALFSLIDAPLNSRTVGLLRNAVFVALERWEPRIKATQVKVLAAKPGQVELEITGDYLPDGKKVTISGIQVK